ncbi:MAG TPA: cytochrome c biogenesis protein CcdA [Polyangia bacterium]|nr:cytochrome c biogenesis protein CcdA [Polyangia bacterium]
MTSSPTVAFALGFGLLTALTPCVYPMIPITLAIFGAKGVGRRRAAALASSYVAGIAVLFGALGTTFGLLGKAFGAYLGNPWVVVPLALFFVAMALSMFGAFELALPQGLQARLSRVGGRGFGGAFLMGLVAGLIAAPCTGPPLAGLLAYISTTHDAAFGFVLCAVYGLGVGLPFLLLAAFSMSLPRSGAWMESVKSVFGVVLLTAALYYLKNVAPPLERFTSRELRFAGLMAALVVAGLLLGAVHLTFHGKAFERARKATGVALAVIGLFGLTNYVLTPKGSVELAWLRDEPAAVADARAAGRPLLVDFMASWCLPCKELELKVFSRPDVAEALQRFTLLRVDLTHEDDDPALPLVKKKYGAETLPAIRLVGPDGALLGKTDEYMEPEAFLRLLNSPGGT